MKEKQRQAKAAKVATWEASSYSNLIRYVPSGTYFARFRVKGKLIWKSLKTDRVSVAQMRLADLEKQERARAEQGRVMAKGKVFFGDALNSFRDKGFRPAVARTPKDQKRLKPAALRYYEERAAALLRSWPALEKTEIRKLTAADCERWAETARNEMAPTSFNHTLGLLRNVIEFGVHIGARYDNPAAKIMRESETSKNLTLPTGEQFEKFVSEIGESGSGWSDKCAELVQFLAFGGLRKTEAAHVTWGDCDFDAGTIIVRGHPETGLKNRQPGETRTIPMIAEMRQLLERMRTERQSEKPAAGVMRVHECQKAMDAAAKRVGMARITHHDLKHLFATRCIESGVDIPTVSRWLGHKDGGALAMRVYGHLRDQHSTAMAQRVTFSKQTAANVVPMLKEAAI